jgi:hypothetical protein
MTMLTTHNFNGQTIRMITGIDGEWFGLKDVVRALQLEEPPIVWWSMFDDSERKNKSILCRDGRQYLRVVNRDGVRKMLDQSPVAIDFKRWAEGELGKNSDYTPIKPASADATSTNSGGLLTPTKIGQAIGGLSAQQVNKLLVDLGMQQPLNDFDKRRYMLTEVGQLLGVTMAVKKNNNEEVDSVLWKEPIIKLVGALARAEQRTSDNA